MMNYYLAQQIADKPPSREPKRSKKSPQLVQSNIKRVFKFVHDQLTDKENHFQINDRSYLNRQQEILVNASKQVRPIAKSGVLAQLSVNSRNNRPLTQQFYSKGFSHNTQQDNASSSLGRYSLLDTSPGRNAHEVYCKLLRPLDNQKQIQPQFRQRHSTFDRLIKADTKLNPCLKFIDPRQVHRHLHNKTQFKAAQSFFMLPNSDKIDLNDRGVYQQVKDVLQKVNQNQVFGQQKKQRIVISKTSRNQSTLESDDDPAPSLDNFRTTIKQLLVQAHVSRRPSVVTKGPHQFESQLEAVTRLMKRV